ncbi:hypothetical protein ACHAWX_005795 [Stephanocyclus meneghinianus]
MKTSSSSAASASTLTYESDISSRRSHYLNGYNTSNHSKKAKQEEARLFDLVLKKLETVRMVKTRERIHHHSSHDIGSSRLNSDHDAARRSDAHVQQRDDLRPLRRADHSMREYVSEHDESVVTDTEDSSIDDSASDSSRGRFSSRDFMPIHRTAQFGGTNNSHHDTTVKKAKQATRPDDNSFSEEKLPDAILKLDRRHAIPRPRHKNDILVEIEACTIERRSLANRPGVRSCIHPAPIETIAVDCVGRVVQLTTHARAIHGVALEDRVAALYPFDYAEKTGDKRGRRCGVGQRKGLERYALVDAGFVVTVPKHVDGTLASTLIRLYMTAFQSIQMGVLHNIPTTSHDRYDLLQLEGQSILIQDGHTELGLAVIDMAIVLGAHQIFATGPSEHHPRLRGAGATPLGKKTFGWELFLTEKLNLVLLQELPSMEIFEQFVRLLDDDQGSIVKINLWPQRQGGDDENELTNNNVLANENVGCDGGLHLGDLAEKARCAFEEAKFHLRLACCSQFLTYDGVWASSKEDPNLWKEDLRFLFALLSEGNLRPRVYERICLEDVAETQDRIELYGKDHSIRQKLTAFAEDRDMNESAVSMLHENFPGGKGRIVLKGYEHCNNSTATCSTTRRSEIADSRLELAMMSDSAELDFAVASGYVRGPVDTLSDFHYLSDSRHGTNRPTTNNSIPVPRQHMSGLRSSRRQEFRFNDDDWNTLIPNSEIPACTHHISSQTVPGDKTNIGQQDASNEICQRFQNSSPKTIRIDEKKSRHGRIIQRQKVAKERRFKTQQHQNHNYACRHEETELSQPFQMPKDPSKDAPNAKFQWKKARRDARAKSRASERLKSHQTVQCKTPAGINSGNYTVDVSETSTCYENAESETVEETACKSTDNLQGLKKNSVHESEIACLKSFSSPDTHSNFAELDSSHIVKSIKRMTEAGTRNEKLTQSVYDEQENEEAASFHLLMRKWKSIEDSKR